MLLIKIIFTFLLGCIIYVSSSLASDRCSVSVSGASELGAEPEANDNNKSEAGNLKLVDKVNVYVRPSSEAQISMEDYSRVVGSAQRLILAPLSRAYITNSIFERVRYNSDPEGINSQVELSTISTQRTGSSRIPIRTYLVDSDSNDVFYNSDSYIDQLNLAIEDLFILLNDSSHEVSVSSIYILLYFNILKIDYNNYLDNIEVQVSINEDDFNILKNSLNYNMDQNSYFINNSWGKDYFRELLSQGSDFLEEALSLEYRLNENLTDSDLTNLNSFSELKPKPINLIKRLFQRQSASSFFSSINNYFRNVAASPVVLTGNGNSYRGFTHSKSHSLLVTKNSNKKITKRDLDIVLNQEIILKAIESNEELSFLVIKDLINFAKDENYELSFMATISLLKHGYITIGTTKSKDVLKLYPMDVEVFEAEDLSESSNIDIVLNSGEIEGQQKLDSINSVYQFSQTESILFLMDKKIRNIIKKSLSIKDGKVIVDRSWWKKGITVSD